MWCAILDNRQIQLRDLHSVKDLSTNLEKKKKFPEPAMEQSSWLSVVTPSHNTVGKYIPFPALWLGVLDLGGRQTRAQITALLLTSCMTFGK